MIAKAQGKGQSAFFFNMPRELGSQSRRAYVASGMCGWLSQDTKDLAIISTAVTARSKPYIFRNGRGTRRTHL